MIVLDTNYLVAIVYRHQDAAEKIQGWLRRGEAVVTSAVAWAEFLTWSVNFDDIRRMETLVGDVFLPCGKAEAECAARIYREARCKREDRIDTLIAGTAIIANASLATYDRGDFMRFVPLGLKLA